MKYFAKPSYQHDAPRNIGILLVNLGTPEQPTPKAVKRYLNHFLSDPRIIEFPRVLWWLILNLIILPLRSRTSAKAYQKIWTKDGSPLLTYSLQIKQTLQETFKTHGLNRTQIELAMSYSEPSIENTLNNLMQKDIKRLLILPLFPQYSATTTGSVFDRVTNYFKTQRWIPEIRFINAYHSHPLFINALAQSVQQHIDQHNMPDKLLFSFHGIPKRYFLSGDPYFCFCQKTARLVTEALNLTNDQWQISFQSRVGREPWLKPYTDEVLTQWAQQSIEHVAVISPGFAVDCLETLEEIDMRYRELFIKNGGKTFQYIPALNHQGAHIEFLLTLIRENTDNWPEMCPDSNKNQEKHLQERLKLYQDNNQNSQ